MQGLAQNPRILAAHHRIEAARARIDQTIALPDPMVNTTSFVDPVQTAAGEQEFGLGISQKLVRADRRHTRAALESEQVAIAQARLKQDQLQLAQQIRSVCVRLIFLRKTQAVIAQDQLALADIEEAIIRKYEVDQDVSQQDVLNVQVERSKVENQITDLKKKERVLESTLARLLDVGPQTYFQIEDELASYSDSYAIDLLLRQALDARPELQVQLAQIRQATKKIHLARLQRQPDFTLGVNWISTSNEGVSPVANGDDAVLVGVGFNLPVNRQRIRAAICEAQSMQRASEYELAGIHADISEEIVSLVETIEALQTTIELVSTDIVPKAEQSLNMSIDEFAAGDSDYVELVENWRSLFKYRLSELQLRSEFHQTLVDLRKAIGEL